MNEKEIISLGGGKQSTYLTITALEGKYGKEVDKIYFSNIKGSELNATMQHLEWFNDYINKRFGVTFEEIKLPSLYDELLEYIDGKRNRASNIPLYTVHKTSSGQLQRGCTPDYKIIPIERQIKKDFGKKVNINMWLGISYDEMQRVRISTKKWRTNYYPLVENRIRLFDIITWFKNNNLPIPPKSSCIFCPFHNDQYWIELYTYYPDEFKKAIYLDDRIRNYPNLYSECYLHQSCKPLKEIIKVLLANKEKVKLQGNLFSNKEMINECYAHCGT